MDMEMVTFLGLKRWNQHKVYNKPRHKPWCHGGTITEMLILTIWRS